MLVALLVASGAEYARVLRQKKGKQALNIANIVIATTVLSALGVAVQLLVAHRAEDPRRFVRQGEPHF